jgi:hypothetical protein
VSACKCKDCKGKEKSQRTLVGGGPTRLGDSAKSRECGNGPHVYHVQSWSHDKVILHHVPPFYEGHDTGIFRFIFNTAYLKQTGVDLANCQLALFREAPELQICR